MSSAIGFSTSRCTPAAAASFDLAGMCERRQRDDQQIELRISSMRRRSVKAVGAEARGERREPSAHRSAAARDELHLDRTDARPPRRGARRCRRSRAGRRAVASCARLRRSVRTAASPVRRHRCRANRAGASSKGTVCVISGSRFKRPSCCRRTALCHSRSLFQRWLAAGRDARDLRADQLDAVVMELLAQRSARALRPGRSPSPRRGSHTRPCGSLRRAQRARPTPRCRCRRRDRRSRP